MRCSDRQTLETFELESWIKNVRAGDFTSIPADLTFESGVELAHLIDGYRVKGGVIECGNAARPVIAEIRRTGRSTASALDIWASLFFAHRACRFGGYPPSDDELVVMDNLAHELRAALIRATLEERERLIELMRSHKDGMFNANFP